jgi:hypothetical protein
LIEESRKKAQERKRKREEAQLAETGAMQGENKRVVSVEEKIAA